MHKTTLKKESKVERVRLLDFKISYKATIIKIIWFRQIYLILKQIYFFLSDFKTNGPIRF